MAYRFGKIQTKPMCSVFDVRTMVSESRKIFTSKAGQKLIGSTYLCQFPRRWSKSYHNMAFSKYYKNDNTTNGFGFMLH